jgi:hypothetical protein
MKPERDDFTALLTQGAPILPNNINPLLKTGIHKSRAQQKLKSSPAQTLKQQEDNCSRQQWISEAAYYKAEARGFMPGCELLDWLEAERDYIQLQVDLFLLTAKEDGVMTLTGLQQLAQALGLHNPGRIVSKSALIRLIQKACCQPSCYKVVEPGEFCQNHAECQWRPECQKLVAEWQR